ncbi:MAG: TPM domain-containing protein [Eubacterium sp.]
MKKIIIWMMVCIACLIPCVPVSAQDAGNSGQQNQRLVDEADLMTSEEEARVMEKLDEVSALREFDVVVVTVNSTGQKTPQEFADDFYDAYGYGYGRKKTEFFCLSIWKNGNGIFQQRDMASLR